MNIVEVILGLILAIFLCKKFVFPFLDKLEKKEDTSNGKPQE